MPRYPYVESEKKVQVTQSETQRTRHYRLVYKCVFSGTTKNRLIKSHMQQQFGKIATRARCILAHVLFHSLSWHATHTLSLSLRCRIFVCCTIRGNDIMFNVWFFCKLVKMPCFFLFYDVFSAMNYNFLKFVLHNRNWRWYNYIMISLSISTKSHGHTRNEFWFTDERKMKEQTLHRRKHFDRRQNIFQFFRIVKRYHASLLSAIRKLFLACDVYVCFYRSISRSHDITRVLIYIHKFISFAKLFLGCGIII